MTDAKAMRKAILAALASWKALPAEKRGPGFDETESRLSAWAEELGDGRGARA